MTEGTASDTPKEFQFQAEVAKVLDIVINSLYSNREVFLRELISNAADAIDKLRFRSLTDPALLGDEKDLEIRLVPDEEAKTLTIADSGIGMTRDELVQNLGTIAHSGTARFQAAMAESGDAGKADLIGQFGVGFYSAFIVADKVTVRTRAAGAEESHVWESDGRGAYSVGVDDDLAGRGTSITLHLKEDAGEFLQEFRLKSLVQRYSDFVSFPIKLLVTKTEGEGDEQTTTRELETVNKASALWRRPKSEITTEDYEEFYKHVTSDYEVPLETVHFKAEGTLEFSALLFVPKVAPFDLYDPASKRGVRLYVKRVFIMEDCEVLLPEYLRFVKGVIDSDDLPLNVSREMLQEDRVTRAIRTKVTTKVLDAIEGLAEDKDDYATFWSTFGTVLKEGLHQDFQNKEKLAKLLRFASSKSELTSLAEYVERAPEDQEAIYYAIGQTKDAVRNSPHIEALRAKDIEVLYLSDTIDEWVVGALDEFEGKKLTSAMKTDLDLDPEEKAEAEKEEKELEDLTSAVGKILDEEVSEVRLSRRLTDSPACLVTPEHGMHAHIERLMQAQGRGMPAPKRILEINPGHPIIQSLEALRAKEPGSESVGDWVRLIHDQALLAEGSPIADPQGFARRMSKLMSAAMPGESDQAGA